MSFSSIIWWSSDRRYLQDFNIWRYPEVKVSLPIHHGYQHEHSSVGQQLLPDQLPQRWFPSASATLCLFLNCLCSKPEYDSALSTSKEPVRPAGTVHCLISHIHLNTFVAKLFHEFNIYHFIIQYKLIVAFSPTHYVNILPSLVVEIIFITEFWQQNPPSCNIDFEYQVLLGIKFIAHKHWVKRDRVVVWAVV